ncbi:restriction system protein [Gammaproteobacteria bacterium]
MDELRTLIEPQLLRRMKTDVKKDLPPKIIEQSCRTLPLSEFQLGLYRRVQSEYVQAWEGQTEGDDEQKNKNEPEKEHEANPLLRMIHQLRLICADPREPGLKPDLGTKSMRKARQKSPKLGWLLDRLGEIHGMDEKAIVFTDFRDIQLGLQHYIESVFGIRPAIVNGSTKTTSKRGGHSRQSIIDDFQTALGFNVLILGTTAIGFGVNIVGANHVIHYTRAWNPAKEDQATDRAYRIGQTRPVHVYYPTVTSPHFVTFEAKLDLLLDSKRNLSEDILNGIPGLTLEDWEDLQTVVGRPAYTPMRVLPKYLEHIEARAFERLCLRLWQQQGYTDVYSTPTIGDGGVDVVAINRDTGRGCLIQCKTSAHNRPMGWDAVKDVVTGAAAYEYRHPKVSFQKIAVTNQHLSNAASKHKLMR